jgi:hypothetical protein
VRRIIDEQYKLARDLIEEHSDKMHAMAKALLEWETIDAEQIDDIMAGKPPRPPKDWTPRNPVGGGDGGSGGTPAVAPAGGTPSGPAVNTDPWHVDPNWPSQEGLSRSLTRTVWRVTPRHGCGLALLEESTFACRPIAGRTSTGHRH